MLSGDIVGSSFFLEIFAKKCASSVTQEEFKWHDSAQRSTWRSAHGPLKTKMSLDSFYGVWRRLRNERVVELFLSLGFTLFDVSRIMVMQFLSPSGSTFDPAGMVFPAIALTEHGSITRTISLVLNADPVATLYGGRAMQESAKYNKDSNTLIWRRKFQISGIYYTLRLTRSVAIDAKKQRIMTCQYESINELTKATETATSWFLHVDHQPPPRLPSYFPLWTWGDDKEVTAAERPLAFSLSPALVGRAVSEVVAATAITKESPPKIYIQQVLQCERMDMKAAQSMALAAASAQQSGTVFSPPPPVFSADELDVDCDPAPWTLVADGVHLDPRKCQQRTLQIKATHMSHLEGHNTAFLPNKFEAAAPAGSVAPGRLLLHTARPFRYRYIPVSSLQQGTDDYPSDVAFSVLRDWVVLQGDGSSVSAKVRIESYTLLILFLRLGLGLGLGLGSCFSHGGGIVRSLPAAKSW